MLCLILLIFFGGQIFHFGLGKEEEDRSRGGGGGGGKRIVLPPSLPDFNFIFKIEINFISSLKCEYLHYS